MKKPVPMTFAVKFEPDDGGWLAWVPSVQGCRTWGRSLAAARRGIREALATCTDVLGAEAERIAQAAKLDEDFKLPAEAKREVARRRRVVSRAEAAEKSAQDATREAARSLARTGLSLRDTGAILGLSHERVKQVLAQKG